MARPIWKGHISFGLVSVPVVLYSGEQRTDLSFRLIDSRNRSPVRYQRINELSGEEVPWDQIVKAYEYDGGNYVVMEEEDFKRAAVEATKSIDIENFVDKESIPITFFEKPYYLLPDKKGDKGYVLLRETLKRANRVGIAKVVIHTRQHLAALMPLDDALVLDLLRFNQELRSLDQFEFPTGKLDDYKISKREIDMAVQLVETMTTDWDPLAYHDEYRDALMEYINKKIEAGGKPLPQKEEEEPEEIAEVVDIMDLLKRSMAAAGKGKKHDLSEAKAAAGKISKAAAKKKPAKPKSPPTKKREVG